MTDHIRIKPLQPVPVDRVKIHDSFWGPKLETFRTTTLIDSFSKFEKDRGGAFNNFDRVRDGQSGAHAGPPWFDGLIYEMIRAASDFLAYEWDDDLDQRLDGYIARIAAAAKTDPDGYINTWTQLEEPDHRWGFNGGHLRWQHDVYNAGMLTEAAVHHYRATRKTTLLAVAITFANHMCERFGPPPKLSVVPSHSGPEEALVKLYILVREHPLLKETFPHIKDETKYLKLVEYWMENRGVHAGGPGWDTEDYTVCDAYIRNQEYGATRPGWGSYAQDHRPAPAQDTIEGHAVRATLMCTGLIAAARENRREDYLTAAIRLWENMAHRRMHLNGGVGAFHQDEKFGPDYYLPNDAYLETCAAVGAGFFHQEMGIAFADAKYADEVERVLYNNILNGVSQSGTRYFYENPLVSRDNARWDWHDCPCCPPMFLKFMAALPGYIYAHSDEAVYINQHIGSKTEIDLQDQSIHIEQQTAYPWEGSTTLIVTPEQAVSMSLFIRIPGWVSGVENSGGLYTSSTTETGAVQIRINGDAVETPDIKDGYACLTRTWYPGDTVQLEFSMPIRRIHAHPDIEADQGRVALQRGPMVYCFESLDNPEDPEQYVLKPDDTLHAVFDPGLLGGVTIIKGNAWRTGDAAGMLNPVEITAIPFYAQRNRSDTGTMIVWISCG